MKNLQDVLMVFHDSADCPGIITTSETGGFICAECGLHVGQLDPQVLGYILDQLEKAPA